MRKQNLYLILMLSLLLGQNSIANANSGDPMNVQTNSKATVTVTKVSDNEQKAEKAAPEQEEISAEDAAQKCASNRQSLSSAVAKYNKDHATMMTSLDISKLVSEGYLSESPSKPAPECSYKASGDLTDDGHIICCYHGGEEAVEKAKEEKKIVK